MMSNTNNFQRLFLGILVALICLGAEPPALAQNSPAGGNAVVFLRPWSGEATRQVGDTARIRVYVNTTGLTGQNGSGASVPLILASYVIPIGFNTSCLRFEGAVAGSTTPYNSTTLVFTTPSIANAQGFVAVTATQLNTSSPNGVVHVATLSFTVLANCNGTIRLTFNPTAAPHATSLSSAFMTAGGNAGPALVPYKSVNGAISIPSTSQVFNDTPPSHYAYWFVQAFSARKITAGCSSSPPLYCPDNPVTRGQMSVFLLAALGYSPVAGPPYSFADIAAHYARNYIEKAYQLGVATGCGGGNFCPDVSLKRSDMAEWMIRALGLQPNSSGSPIFNDVPPSHPSYGYVQQLYYLGITAGCGNSNFCPDSPCTRAQMAVFIVGGGL